jgi:hypothetical protein
MKHIGLLLAVVVGLSGQTPASPASAPAPMRTIVYQFGYNTKVASSGPNTGTTTVTIGGTAADGGTTVSGADFWWNTVRSRGTNTCEVYPNGNVSCMNRPYAISPMQLAVFPMLGKNYFKGLSAAGTGTWKRTIAINRGDLYKWTCTFTLQGKGPIAGTGGLIKVVSNGTCDQVGGHYRSGTEKGTIVFDPTARIPVIVSDVRTHLPQTNVYNQDGVELKINQNTMPK